MPRNPPTTAAEMLDGYVVLRDRIEASDGDGELTLRCRSIEPMQDAILAAPVISLGDVKAKLAVMLFCHTAEFQDASGFEIATSVLQLCEQMGLVTSPLSYQPADTTLAAKSTPCAERDGEAIAAE